MSFDEATSSMGDEKQNESLTRSFAKAISWRVVGTIDTFLLSFVTIKFAGMVFSDSVPTENVDIATTAAYIAVAEVVTKIIIYMVHERIWNRISWGHTPDGKKLADRKRRSFVKTATWRVLASLDTTLLSWFFTGSIATAMTIGGLEVLTKLLLYYLHERAWLRVKWI